MSVNAASGCQSDLINTICQTAHTHTLMNRAVRPSCTVSHSRIIILVADIVKSFTRDSITYPATMHENCNNFCYARSLRYFGKLSIHVVYIRSWKLSIVQIPTVMIQKFRSDAAAKPLQTPKTDHDIN